jgi:2-polyprenyl-3-methyl-5-hydroxy-6-metoxy-1,4-benzoquinol methylase
MIEATETQVGMSIRLRNESEYAYSHARPTYEHNYLVKPALEFLRESTVGGRAARVFDLGCGNGAIGAALHDAGFALSGVDTSRSGIAAANRAYPYLDLRVGSAYDDLASVFGKFPIVVSFEVVEHLYYPRHFATTVYDLVEPGGIAVVSTPYHGYLKNLLIALAGRFDAHADPLWEHGHIKFWSPRTLSSLLCDAGFETPRVIRVGRVPVLAKSMIAIARKPD